MQTATITKVSEVRPTSTTRKCPQYLGCGECNRQNNCLAHLLSEHDLAAFEDIIAQPRKLDRGDYLYQAGDGFHAFYVIRSGSLKTSIIDEEGREQILGFPIQGDIVALDDLRRT